MDYKIFPKNGIIGEMVESGVKIIEVWQYLMRGGNNGGDEYWKYYEGEYRKGVRQGKGLLMFENGERFEGSFKNDCVDGEGIFYGKNHTISGTWKNNIILKG